MNTQNNLKTREKLDTIFSKKNEMMKKKEYKIGENFETRSLNW